MTSAFERYVLGVKPETAMLAAPEPPSQSLVAPTEELPIQKATPYEANRPTYPERARQLVFDYVKDRLEKTDTHITFELRHVYVVSFSFVLNGWKAMVSTTLPDGMYYEVTYDPLKKQTYVDAYKKWDNVAIPDEVDA